MPLKVRTLSKDCLNHTEFNQNEINDDLAYGTGFCMYKYEV